MSLNLAWLTLGGTRWRHKATGAIGHVVGVAEDYLMGRYVTLACMNDAGPEVAPDWPFTARQGWMHGDHGPHSTMMPVGPRYYDDRRVFGPELATDWEKIG